MVIPGELVVELGGRRLDVEFGQVGTMVELYGYRSPLPGMGAALLEHEGKGRESRGIALEDDLDGVSKLVLSIVVEQKQKLRDQASRRLAFLEGLVEEEMGFGQDGFESAEVERGLSLFAEFEKCLSMLGGFQELASVEAPAVDGHDGRAIQDADLGVGSGEGEVFTDGVWRNGILIEIKTDEDSFGGESRLEQLDLESVLRQRQKVVLFLAKDIEDPLRVFLGMRPEKRLVAPQVGFPIEVDEVGEVPALEEALANEPDGSLDATFLIASSRGAELWLEVVMGAKLEKPGMKASLAAEAFQNSGLEVVVEQAPGAASKRLEGPDVAQEEVFECLVEEELEVEGAGVGQREHEAGKAPFGLTDANPSEVSPVNLTLLPREELQACEDLGHSRSQATDEASQLSDAAGVSTVSEHGEHPRRLPPGRLVASHPLRRLL